MSAGKEFQRLIETMERLRAECPWDRCQDFDSLRKCLLEETYEVLEALDERNYRDLEGELGDLLLQVVFLCRIAEERGLFAVGDVLRGLNEKLVRRHPHVFAGASAQTPDEALARWQHIKTELENQTSSLDGVPGQLPSLLKAVRVLGKMRRAGLDLFEHTQPAELARASLEALAATPEECDGDEATVHAANLLLASAILCERHGADPEDALRGKLGAIATAFRTLENRLRSTGRKPEELSASDRASEGKRLLDARPQGHCRSES